MKKALSILLAMVMVFSMSVFAFAAATEQTLDKATPTGDVVIKTTDKDGTGKDAKKYSITIPADTEIAWGTETTTLNYKVESHLGHGEAVKVTVTGNGAMSYVASAEKTYTLAYTLTDAEFTATEPTLYPAVDETVTVGVTANDWNEAVVGEYSDVLTFTAALVTA